MDPNPQAVFSGGGTGEYFPGYTQGHGPAARGGVSSRIKMSKRKTLYPRLKRQFCGGFGV